MPSISGTVYDDAGAPAAGRIVRVYRRDTGELLGSAVTSDGIPIAGDTHYANVSLLLHCDGADGSTVFTDSSAAPKTVTAYGNAKISTAQSKFGGASGRVDGSSGCYITTANTAAFQFGSGDFAIEGFVRPNSKGAIVGSWRGLVASDCAWLVEINASGHLSFTYGVGSTNAAISSGAAFPLSVWSHFAVVRQGSTVRFFINGILVSTGSLSGVLNYYAAEPVVIGAVSVISTPSGAARGDFHIDDLRITKGVARYTDNFTPPAAPHYDRLPADATPVGSYSTTTAYTGEVQRIVLDDDAGTLYNDLIDRVVLT